MDCKPPDRNREPQDKTTSEDPKKTPVHQRLAQEQPLHQHDRKARKKRQGKSKVEKSNEENASWNQAPSDVRALAALVRYVWASLQEWLQLLLAVWHSIHLDGMKVHQASW